MRNILFTLLLLLSLPATAQKGITFEVEKLSKPKGLLWVQPYDEIYKSLILSDAGLRLNKRERHDDFPYGIVAQSVAPDSLVTYGYNSFFDGMYEAYANHRPFVLSPDMIWLLISQGFARHVNANHEALRNRFVDFTGKATLIVQAGCKLDDPTLSWEELFPGFMKQIKQYAGKELVDGLTCDFSTTTSVEKIASQITVMEAVKPYFEFVIMYIGCGIPEITLEGTPKDWEKVLEKARKLKTYDLDWWISELEPLLTEFVNASKGKVDKDFWRNMFKYHSQEKYGAPKIIDGWIIKFFPYDKHGKRNNLKQLAGSSNLPQELVKVDLKFIEAYNDTVINIPLELWAGFVGLQQNNENFALRPQIGWMVRKKDTNEEGLKGRLEKDTQTEGLGEGVTLRVNEFPTVLLRFDVIKQLELAFIGKIDIPDELAKVEIKNLELSGEIDSDGIERIKKMFPNTKIRINRKLINGEEQKIQFIID